MRERRTLIFASLSTDDKYSPEEIVDDLERFYDGLEYGDVLDGEYQIWEYPSGQIFQLEPDREVPDKDYYAAPHSKDGVVWLPRLTPIRTDKERVAEAYRHLTRPRRKQTLWSKLFGRKTND
jgi:hypothetical protein